MSELANLSPDDKGVDLTRRRVLKAGGFSVAFSLMGAAGPARAIMNARLQPGDATAAAADGNPAFAPNAFIRIDTNGTVRLSWRTWRWARASTQEPACCWPKSWVVGLDQVKVEHAPPSDELYGNPIFYLQATGGSTSTRGNWRILREAGAVATHDAHRRRRRALEGGSSNLHSRTRQGQALLFRPFARIRRACRRCGRLPQPAEVKLKDRKDFALIGKPMRRVDTAGKVNGTTQFGLDVRLPGMKVATVMACPTFGGRLASVDDSRARAIPGGDRCHSSGQCSSRNRRALLGRQKGFGSAEDRMGSRRERPPHDRGSSKSAGPELA